MMKWFDKLIGERLVKINDEILDLKNSGIHLQEEFNKFIENNLKRIQKINFEISDFDSAINRIDREILDRQTAISLELKKLNLKIDERERQMRDDYEVAISVAIKTIDKRLGNMGEKKGVVTDLLKRIAALEK